VLASHRGGPNSVPGRDMSVPGSLVEDEDDLSQVSSYLFLLRNRFPFPLSRFLF